VLRRVGCGEGCPFPRIFLLIFCSKWAISVHPCTVCIFLGFVHRSAVLPQREEIAMKLNSVALDANDTFQDVLTDYFGENDDSDSESESDSFQ